MNSACCIFPQVYDTELEEVEEFDGFNDFMKTFVLLRGKKTEDEDDEQRRFSGKFKVSPKFVCFLFIFILLSFTSWLRTLGYREATKNLWI